jgi:tRNA(Ile)-lysidine synthase
LAQELAIPPWARERIPLLLVDGRLAAIGDLLCCEEFAATPGTPAWLPAWDRPAWLRLS